MRATGSLVVIFSSGGGLIQAAVGIGGSRQACLNACAHKTHRLRSHFSSRPNRAFEFRRRCSRVHRRGRVEGGEACNGTILASDKTSKILPDAFSEISNVGTKVQTDPGARTPGVTGSV